MLFTSAVTKSSNRLLIPSNSTQISQAGSAYFTTYFIPLALRVLTS